MALKVPYGLTDFYKLISQGYFYQDRTDKIPLLEAAGDQLLFIRPRRFGKSLLLSMLENYYDLNKAEQFAMLFGQLAIGNNPTPLHNQYFVMKWDFSSVAAYGDIKEIEQAIHEHINDRCYQFLLTYQKYFEHSVTLNAHNALSSFNHLLAAIKQTPYKLYLLIDEYDNFANEVMMAKNEHYHDLLKGEGLLKTVFKNVKSAAGGLGLDKVFITGVSPVVMSDMTSGYNVAKNIYLLPKFNDLCGFTEAEIKIFLQQIAKPPQVDEALSVMRTFYNGYCFAQSEASTVYNPTLSLYFLDYYQEYRRYPHNFLDENLAMDRNKLEYIARLPHGETLIVQALSDDTSIAVNQLSERFGVADVLNAIKDQTFMASLLYYFGILTQAGMDPLFGQLQLKIPNLVARTLYVERLQALLLSEYDERLTIQRSAQALCLNADLQPLCDFIEQRYFNILSNHDYRWSNELIIKVAFMTLLYNDNLYMMISETESNRRYVDLSLIVRPDKRQFKALDLVIEFKYLSLEQLKLNGEQLKALSVEQLHALPLVAEKRVQALQQARDYVDSLQLQYPQAKLHGFAVIALGFERIVWQAFKK